MAPIGLPRITCGTWLKIVLRSSAEIVIWPSRGTCVHAMLAFTSTLAASMPADIGRCTQSRPICCALDYIGLDWLLASQEGASWNGIRERSVGECEQQENLLRRWARLETLASALMWAARHARIQRLLHSSTSLYHFLLVPTRALSFHANVLGSSSR